MREPFGTALVPRLRTPCRNSRVWNHPAAARRRGLARVPRPGRRLFAPPAAQELSLRRFFPVPDERQQLACMVRDVDCLQRAGSLLEKLYDLDYKARRLIVGTR